MATGGTFCPLSHFALWTQCLTFDYGYRCWAMVSVSPWKGKVAASASASSLLSPAEGICLGHFSELSVF